MSELPDRIRRAFERHGAFEPKTDGVINELTTEPSTEEEAATQSTDDSAAAPIAGDSIAAPSTGDDPVVRYAVTTTPFESIVEARPVHDRLVRFRILIGVPMLNRVTEDHVADVVEEGWYETFERRVEDIGAVTRRDRNLDPTVRTDGERAIVTVSIEDRNVDRGLDDAKAIVDYVEGTYVQGIIPGYEYTGAVEQLISRARSTGETARE